MAGSPPVGILGATSVAGPKLEGGEEEVQEAVLLALPSVAVIEDADPGNHTLKEQDGEGPHEC